MKPTIILPTILAIALFGCGLLGFDSDEPINPITFELTLDKTVVAPGERFTATYTARNETDRRIDVVTSCTAFALIGVFQDGEPVSFNGANYGCFTALGQYVIGPKETLKFEWVIDAFIRTREIGQPYDTIYVAPGDYSLRVISHVSQVNGKNLNVEPLDVEFKVE